MYVHITMYLFVYILPHTQMRMCEYAVCTYACVEMSENYNFV